MALKPGPALPALGLPKLTTCMLNTPFQLTSSWGDTLQLMGCSDLRTNLQSTDNKSLSHSPLLWQARLKICSSTQITFTSKGIKFPVSPSQSQLNTTTTNCLNCLAYFHRRGKGKHIPASFVYTSSLSHKSLSHLPTPVCLKTCWTRDMRPLVV